MSVPTSLALTGIVDDAEIIAADHRNNYSAIQTAVNALIGFFGGASTGSTLRYDGTNWAPTANIIIDDTNGTMNLGGVTGSAPDHAILIANLTQSVSTPTGGGVLFVDAGALKYRGSGGTVTTVAAA